MISKNNNNSKPIVIIGAGGNACTIADYLIKSGKKILGFTDQIKSDFVYENLKIIGVDETILNYKKEEIDLAMGLGITPKNENRAKKIKWFKQRGYNFINIISPSSIVSSNVSLGKGVQISSGTIIQTNVKIDHNSIINTNSSIDHDSVIGANCHIAPGVTVCGHVVIHDNVFVSAGSVIVNGIKIGKNSFIPAGSIITKDLPPNSILKINQSY